MALPGCCLTKSALLLADPCTYFRYVIQTKWKKLFFKPKFFQLNQAPRRILLFLNQILISLQVFLFELIHPDFRGPAAATFALMAALGGSTIALLGAVQPLWRVNMAVLAGMTLATMLVIALTLPESPIWLLRKGGGALKTH